MVDQSPFDNFGNVLSVPDDLPNAFIIGTTAAPEPVAGQLRVDDNTGKVLVHNGDGWNTINAFEEPNWTIKYYILKNAAGTPIGIHTGPIDAAYEQTFTLYLPDHDCPFQPLTYDEIHRNDYSTHVAFETFPVLEVERFSAGGTLLKFPD